MGSSYLHENKQNSKGQKRQKQWRVTSGDWRATGSGKIPSPLRCMGKSPEVIDEKGVAGLRCGERVRNYMKTKGMADPEAVADLTDFADQKVGDGLRGT